MPEDRLVELAGLDQGDRKVETGIRRALEHLEARGRIGELRRALGGAERAEDDQVDAVVEHSLPEQNERAEAADIGDDATVARVLGVDAADDLIAANPDRPELSLQPAGELVRPDNGDPNPPVLAKRCRIHAPRAVTSHAPRTGATMVSTVTVLGEPSETLISTAPKAPSGGASRYSVADASGIR